MTTDFQRPTTGFTLSLKFVTVYLGDGNRDSREADPKGIVISFCFVFSYNKMFRGK